MDPTESDAGAAAMHSPAELRPVAHLRAKAAALLLFTLALVFGSALYLLYSRGVFEPTQQLVLTTDDSEGVVVGMDMTFSGFPIGRVRRIELSEDGNVRIIVDVPRKDAHWLRETSVFTLVRGLVGGTTIKAYSGILTDPALAENAVRPVLRGDATAEIPQIMASAKELLANLGAMTAQDSALGVVMGNEADARKVVQTLERANALIARMEQLVVRADRQVFDADGVMPEVRSTVVQLNGLLADTRQSLKKVDAVLVEAQAVGANAREATSDLGALRGEVESNLRRLEDVLSDIQRKWPFARKPELELP